jgi:hypothetical protein
MPECDPLLAWPDLKMQAESRAMLGSLAIGFPAGRPL